MTSADGNIWQSAHFLGAALDSQSSTRFDLLEILLQAAEIVQGQQNHGRHLCPASVSSEGVVADLYDGLLQAGFDLKRKY